MVDNITLNTGVGGDVIATDDIGGVEYQIVKLTFGALDSQTIASSGTGTDDAGTQRITLATDISLPTGPVTNAGTFVVQEDGAALTALQIIDNAVHVDDAAFTLGSGSGVMAMGFAGTQSVNANDAAALACETDGALHIHDGGNVITVDGTVTANPASGTIDTVTAVTDITNTIDSTISGDALTALQLIDNPIFADNAGFTLGSSSVNIAGGVFQTGTPGTLADNDAGAILLNSTAGQMVELMASTASIGTLAANSGIDIGDVDVLSLPNVTLAAGTNTNEVVGDVAHDAASAGNPVLIAARAAATVEGLSQVAGADSSFITSDLNGCVVTRNGTTLEEIVSERVSNTDGTSTDMTGAFAAGGAGNHAYVTSVTIHNANASTNGLVDLRDGAAGAIKWTFPAPALGGTTHNFDPPLKFADNTAVAYDVSAAITTVYISLNGYFAQG